MRLHHHKAGTRQLAHRRREVRRSIIGHVVGKRLVVCVAALREPPHGILLILLRKVDAEKVAAEADHVVHARLHLELPLEVTATFRLWRLSAEILILVHATCRPLVRKEGAVRDEPRPRLPRHEALARVVLTLGQNGREICKISANLRVFDAPIHQVEVHARGSAIRIERGRVA